METAELRIGNLIRYSDPEPQDFYTIQVNAISEFTGQIIPVRDINGMEGEEWSIESFEGIPLSEDWLKKFGFVNHDVFWSLHVHDRVGLFQLHHGTHSQSGERYFRRWISGEDGKPVKWVHQLQNMVYSLHEYELTIK